MPKGFQKGVATNPNGRKKGVQNKTTRDIKEAYRQLIEDNISNLTKWMERIAADNPEKAIRILSELSEYVLPKLARTDITSGDKPINPILNITVDSNETSDTLKKLRDGSSDKRLSQDGYSAA